MISSELAQRIVDVVIPLIRCNVNIMDEHGIIIGSGDKRRIGQIHPIARQVIETPNIGRNFSLIVNQTDSQNENMLPGVNLPIFFNNHVIGVVGVTGEPNKIIQQTKLIQYTVELLVWKEYSTNKMSLRRMVLTEFITMVLEKRRVGKNVIQELNNLSIDFESFRYCTIVSSDKKEFDKVIDFIDELYHLVPNAGACKHSNYVVIFSHSKIDFKKFFANYEDLRFYTGCKINTWEDLYKSYNVAKALSLYRKDEKYCTYSESKVDLSIIINYLENPYLYTSDLKKYVKFLKKEILFETYDAYLKHNGVIKDICDSLYTHRNTIIYRLQKIEEITGYNLHKIEDSFRLYSLHIIYQILTKKEKEELE